MKTIKIISFILVLAISMLTVASASDIFSVKTPLDMQETQNSYGISVVSGETLNFSAEDLELRLGLKPQSLDGITVTSLPEAANGELLLDGASIGEFEYIPRDMLSRLSFVPAQEAAATSITFIPRAENATTSELSISVIDEVDQAPTVLGTSYDTVTNVPVSGYVNALDPEDGDISIRVVTPPVNGSVRFDGLHFRYTPFKGVSGKDSFVICAVDSENNFSPKSTINVNIERTNARFYYDDMQVHPSAYAAIKLRESGVVIGTQIGGKYYFCPDNVTTRGEFIIMALVASGLERTVKPTVNTGLPNDADIPYWIKPYVKAAIEADIWSAVQPFLHADIPSRAEAVVLTSRAAKIKDVKDYTIKMSDASYIPQWAMPSYKNLAAYKMLDLHDNVANPAGLLTNSFSADLIWQLWKYHNK